MLLETMSSIMEIRIFAVFVELVGQYNNAFIFLWLSLSVLSILDPRKQIWIICSIVLSALAIFVNHLNIYQLIIGLFVPTLLHVYIFTGLFMLYGALKSNSKMGFISVVFLMLAPIFIWLSNIIPFTGLFSEYVKQAFIDGNFYATNAKLQWLIGIGNGTEFSFDNIIDVKFQVFIAFAYIYHYLNWFSKTSIIGWHKSIDLKSSSLILSAWIISIVLFWYDYSTGIICLLGLSILHVFLEFPLNMISIREIPKLILDRAN